MNQTESGPINNELNPELDTSRSRIDADLKIMEAHPAEMAAIESDIQDSMKKWDREYKDSHFHSVPKGLRHQR